MPFRPDRRQFMTGWGPHALHDSERQACEHTLQGHPALRLTCEDAYSHVLGVKGGPE